MENGKYNLIQAREIHRYSLPSILPSCFFQLFFFFKFIFWETFFPLREKDSNSAGPNPPTKNRADIEVRALPAKAPAEASSSAGWAKENCLSKSHQRDFSVALTPTFCCLASILRNTAPIKV